MERYNFHNTSYGWNYFVELVSTGRLRFGRYYTNGHQNSNEQRTRWVDDSKVEVSDIKKYVAAKKDECHISDTLAFNANVECQRAVEKLSR